MKVLLIKDVYNLGRAGDVKKVADGYGRNFLVPQGFAVLATLGALKQSENIRARASIQRAELNKEMGGIAEQINGLVVTFSSKAGETGKLYGSITTQMIADAINSKIGTTFDRRSVEIQPIRNLGEHKAKVRLTMDLVPEVKVVVHRDGEVIQSILPDDKSAVETPVAEAAAPVESLPVEEPEVTEETKSAEVTSDDTEELTS